MKGACSETKLFFQTYGGLEPDVESFIGWKWHGNLSSLGAISEKPHSGN